MNLNQAFKPTKYNIGWGMILGLILLLLGTIFKLFIEPGVVWAIFYAIFSFGFLIATVLGVVLIGGKLGLIGIPLALFVIPLFFQVLYGYLIFCVATFFKHRKDPTPFVPTQPTQENIFVRIEKVIVLTLLAGGDGYLVFYILRELVGNTVILSGFGIKILFIVYLSVVFGILNFFWDRWSRKSLVAWAAVFTLFFFNTSASVLSINSLSFPENVTAFNILIYFLPIMLILPFIGPLATLYAFFRGFMSKQSEPVVSAPVAPETLVQDANTPSSTENSNTVQAVRRNIKLYMSLLVIVVGVFIVFIVSTPLYYIFHTGTKDVQEPTDPAVGKVINLKMPMVYSTDCTGCGGSPKELEINRNLECFSDIGSFYSHLFKDNYMHIAYVPSTETFTVAEVFRPHHYGIQSIDSGPGDYRMYVLRDSKGTLSTALADFVDGDKICPIGEFPSHINKLLVYGEKAGKFKISITVMDDKSYSRVNSTSVGQDRFIKLLENLPNPYEVSDIEKSDSYILGMKAVNMMIDDNTLAYMYSAHTEMGVWEIEGLDPDYVATLTEEDKQGMRRAPIGMNTPSNTSSAPFTSVPVVTPFPTKSVPTKYINTEYNFEFMSDEKLLPATMTGPGGQYKTIFWYKVFDQTNYIMVSPVGGYFNNSVQGTSVTTYEKIGGKNAIAITTKGGGQTFKSYHITDSIPGWAKCDDKLTDNVNCAKIMYFATTPANEAQMQKMIDSFKFR